MTWNVWCSHDKVRKGTWSVLVSGLTEAGATGEVETRRARVNDTCRFLALPEGEVPVPWEV
jgi:hypothetical protein